MAEHVPGFPSMHKHASHPELCSMTMMGYVCLTTDKAASSLLQLKAGLRSQGHGCLHEDSLAQCLVSHCLAKVKVTVGTNNSFMVFLELLEDYSKKIPLQKELVSMPKDQEFLMYVCSKVYNN